MITKIPINKAIIKSILIKIALFYVVIVVLMFSFQRNFMYLPSMGKYSLSNIPEGFEEVRFQTGDDIELKGWKSKNFDKNKKTLLYFHGNAGTLNNRSHRIKKLKDIGLNVLIISYRGYSENEGSPNEKGFYIDAQSAIKFLNENKVADLDIIIYGESIGSGVAIHAAQNKNVAGVIVEAPFTSVLEVAQNYYPYLPTSLMLMDRFESSKKIKNISSPILIIHGESDRVITVEMGKELYRLANEPKSIYIIENDGHSVKYSNELMKKIKKFTKSL